MGGTSLSSGSHAISVGTMWNFSKMLYLTKWWHLMASFLTKSITTSGDTWKLKFLNIGCSDFKVGFQECIAQECKHLDYIIFKTKWQKKKKKKANIVLSYSKTKFWTGSILTFFKFFFITLQTPEIILLGSIYSIMWSCWRLSPFLYHFKLFWINKSLFHHQWLSCSKTFFLY